MRIAMALSVLILFLTATASGCAGRTRHNPGGTTRSEELSDATDPVPTDAAEATTRFALDFYARLRSREGNLFCSPYSVAAALGMTYAGARGETARQMRQVLHVSGEAAQWHSAFADLRGRLMRSADGCIISVANRLWGQQGYEFLSEFLTVTRDSYGAELSRLDFADPERARATINDWVAEETQQKIPDLLPRGTIEDSTRLVLTNAIYFKGTWLAQFDPDRTTDRPFHIDPERTVTVPTMHRKAHFAFSELPGLKVLEIPYVGEEMVMVVLLPDEMDGLSSFEEELTQENLSKWLDSLHEREVQVALPRFTFSSKLDLGTVLSGMGMASAFDARSADFSGMTGQRDLFISAAVHEAYVDVNEQGTEAAAATGIVMGLTSARPGPSFIADHPFIFLIRDRATDAILFLGRVRDPSA